MADQGRGSAVRAGWAGCGIPSTSQRATTRRPGGRARQIGSRCVEGRPRVVAWSGVARSTGCRTSPSLGPEVRHQNALTRQRSGGSETGAPASAPLHTRHHAQAPPRSSDGPRRQRDGCGGGVMPHSHRSAHALAGRAGLRDDREATPGTLARVCDRVRHPVDLPEGYHTAARGQS